MMMGEMAGIVGLGFCWLLFGACAPPESSEDPAGRDSLAELRVSPVEVGAGDEVMITLVNRAEGELGYNLCPAVLDRREGGEWVEEPLRPAEICTMELRLLSPGDSAHYRHTLPAALAGGEYRFRTVVEAPLGGQAEVTSEGFQVHR